MYKFSPPRRTKGHPEGNCIVIIPETILNVKEVLR